MYRPLNKPRVIRIGHDYRVTVLEFADDSAILRGDPATVHLVLNRIVSQGCLFRAKTSS